jgi:folate-binding protein YgfZ
VSGDAHIGTARRDEEQRLWICVGGSPERWLVLKRIEANDSAVSAAGSPAATVAPTATVIPTTTIASVAPRADGLPQSDEHAAREAWRALDIADGLPQIYTATSEAFVAQMLNLDVVGGVSFEKGCYTGQEVIARAHYRGKVKRRMQRFRTLSAAKLNAGDSGTLNDGRSFKIVEAVQLADGRCEFLAVAPTAAGAEPDETAAAPTSDASPTLAAEQLSLPYSLPA